MEDITFLLQYIDLVTLSLCLCIGFALKQAFNWYNNQYIPLTMLILGAAISVITNLSNINAIVVLSGMISGLASTGLYEMMRNLIDKDGKSK